MKPTFTKIVTTLGPASSGENNIRVLAKAGANVFRLNFSHGDYETHEKNILAIRKISSEMKTAFGILCDMQGPKLRVGTFIEGKITLVVGHQFRLDLDETPGSNERVNLPHPEIFKAVKKGMTLLLNDGQIQLKVVDFGKDFIDTTVMIGGVLSDRKGVNVPDVILPISALTAKDKKDLAFALKMGADWIGLSFVQQPEDVKMARDLIGDKAGIIAKIEKPSAIKHLKEIISLADGIMVARGDLGVECPIEQVPAMQKKILEACRAAGKPVIVATQMLESMINAPVPTRAEVSDVATAVYDGADAVMLSAETAAGQYPFEAVQMMKKIIMQTQSDPLYKTHLENNSMPPDRSIASAITSSIKQVIKVLDKATCIVCYSVSGMTITRTSRERPARPIIGMTLNKTVANRMALYWGVTPVIVHHKLQDMTEVTPIALEKAEEIGFAKSGDEVIITAGIPFAAQGKTNLLHIATVK